MKLLWIAAIGGTLGALSVYNYRKFMPKPSALGETTYKVDKKALLIPANGRTLYGELLTPRGKPGPHPTVICCHGYGSSYKLCINAMGRSLAMSGYQVYCFDFYGGSKSTRSGGRMTEMSIFTEREDLQYVIDAIYELPTTDKQRLFLLGESQGGCVAGITAPTRADKLQAMILYYPAFCIPDDAKKRFASVDEIQQENHVLGQTVGRCYYDQLLEYDVYEDIRGFEKPVLILHGDKDAVVDLSYGKKAADGYAKATFIPMEGEPHGFTGKGKAQAIREAYHFLENIL